MAVTETAGIILLVSRILFGGQMIYSGIGHFTGLEGKVAYAEAKGLPAPKIGTLVGGLFLVLGGLGILIGVFPVVSAILVAVFLLVAAFQIHAYWTEPEEELANQRSHFRKNIGLAGGALAFAAIGMQEWAYSVGIGLFI